MTKVTVKDIDIKVDKDNICLTDMIKGEEGDQLIKNGLGTKTL
jgi:hypothetical protein